MRLLLFIPVLVLFLSNVPIIQRIPLEKAISLMQENETCGQQKECSRNNENFKTTCTKEESACDEASDAETTIQDPASDNCSQKTETTCVCICCFQFAAPVQKITIFQFSCSNIVLSPSTFMDAPVKDPYISAPWQPPDAV